MSEWCWSVCRRCYHVKHKNNGGEKGQRKKARGAVNSHNRLATDEDEDNGDE